MPSNSFWYAAYTQEITRAQSARLSGNDGMARVCARRAAGILAGEYIHRRSLTQPNPSAIQRLKQLACMPDLDPQVRQVIAHFLLSVDKNHRLPPEIDLLSEVQWLAHQLLGI